MSPAENKTAPPVYGLVLAGGKSSRMQTDKAPLLYEGKMQSVRAFEMLTPFCKKVFLSNRADQTNLPGHAGMPQIHDRFGGLGPMAGILSAFELHPDAAWLVLACDLPYLDSATLETLLQKRNPVKVATAFRSAHDGKPEPLCAIYEPQSRDRLRQFIDQGIRCPRKALMNSDIELLEPVNPMALENINTPDEYRQASDAAKRTYEENHPD
jgi:molybdenum cofactor guanylyltransferase